MAHKLGLEPYVGSRLLQRLATDFPAWLSFLLESCLVSLSKVSLLLELLFITWNWILAVQKLPAPCRVFSHKAAVNLLSLLQLKRQLQRRRKEAVPAVPLGEALRLQEGLSTTSTHSELMELFSSLV